MDPQKMHAPVCRNQVLSPPKQSLCHIACQTTLIAPDSDSSGSCNTQMADTDGRHGGGEAQDTTAHVDGISGAVTHTTRDTVQYT